MKSLAALAALAIAVGATALQLCFERVKVMPLVGSGGAELEAWSLRKEAAYFREVFGRDLAVDVA